MNYRTIRSKLQSKPLEDTCLALAMVNAIVAGVTLVLSVVFAVWFIIYTQSPQYPSTVGHPGSEFYPIMTALNVFTYVLIVVATLCALVYFAFALVLCNGLYKRRQRQVQAYFIFGAVTTPLVALGAIEMFSSNDPLPGIYQLFWCVLHVLFLVLVYKTYLKLSGKALVAEHVLLLESEIHDT